MKKIFLAISALVALGGGYMMTMHHDHHPAITLGDLSIKTPYSVEMPPSASAGAAYMEIENTGDQADRLLTIQTDFADAMLHLSAKEDGVMKMIHQKDGISIPAGETTIFKPGSYHIMFMRPKNPLKKGDVKSVTLMFEKAGEVTIDFPVIKRGEKAMDHSNH